MGWNIPQKDYTPGMWSMLHILSPSYIEVNMWIFLWVICIFISFLSIIIYLMPEKVKFSQKGIKITVGHLVSGHCYCFIHPDHLTTFVTVHWKFEFFSFTQMLMNGFREPMTQLVNVLLFLKFSCAP